MRNYDSVRFRCQNPDCCETWLEQTKAGPCKLIEDDQDAVRPEIAIGLIGDTIKCQDCGSTYKVTSNFPRYVQLRLRKVE